MRDGKSIWYICWQIRLKSQSKAVNLSGKLVTEIAESLWVRVMMFNATFNNISVTSWWSHLLILVEEIGVPGENHRPVASHYRTLSNNMLWGAPRLGGIWNIATLVVMCTDCIGSGKSSYHTITSWFLLVFLHKQKLSVKMHYISLKEESNESLTKMIEQTLWRKTITLVDTLVYSHKTVVF